MTTGNAGKSKAKAKPMAKTKKSPVVINPEGSEGATPAASHLVVGLGASAGGLEAYEKFFRAVPVGSDLAFVLVSHLDPDRVSMLTEILQRSTDMPVVEAQDQMAVLPGHVYVIPPNREMAIFQGSLQISMPDAPRGQRMPIDAFFRALAEDVGERAVGIILSGTGTDGTLGLRAIHGAGGLTMVQEPATAGYDGMPLSAIQAGFVTHVLPVDKMPLALQPGSRGLADSRADSGEESAKLSAVGMNRLLMVLRSATGHDFSQYKKSTIARRIGRRMAQHNLADIDVYTRFVKERGDEVQALIKELLINVTSFFRDPEAFNVLKHEILPKRFADFPDDYVFRAWVAGCATGEEAYSIAMLLRELMDESGREFKVQLYGTDLDDDAISIARAGFYPPNIAADIELERLHRFFIKEDNGYRVKKEIREMVVFAVQNVIKDPPFTKLDLLCCRNLMIYLEPELQARLIPAFHYSLKPSGILFLSPSESTGNHPNLFAALNRKWKFYQAIHTTASTQSIISSRLPWTAERSEKGPSDVVKKAKEINLAELTRRVLLQSYAPASVLVDEKGNILFVHGETGKYLRPAPGTATLNVVEMAREGLQRELRAALHNAAQQNAPTVAREITVKADGESKAVGLSVRPLAAADANQGLLLVSFQDIEEAASAKRTRARRPAHGTDGRRVDEIERELAYTRENLQATIEEQQASNEELKSTNEELQSTNEELQSTNEELETSKEELQSVNEELVTVNAELQAKIEQLACMQNDMKNLLDNVSGGIVFLDQNLVIRRFTREAARVYRLVPSDVGRQLADIKSDLAQDDLLVDARIVLDTLVPCEREVQTFDGAWYLVRVQPYRTLDNMIDGVVLSFSNISQRVAADARAKNARRLAEGIVDTLPEPLLVLDGAQKVVSANRSFYQHFGVAPEHTIGRVFYTLGNGQWDIPLLREKLSAILPRDEAFSEFLVERDFPNMGHCKWLLNARRVVSDSDDMQLIMVGMKQASEGG